jgi:hypothetical protein
MFYWSVYIPFNWLGPTIPVAMTCKCNNHQFTHNPYLPNGMSCEPLQKSINSKLVVMLSLIVVHCESNGLKLALEHCVLTNLICCPCSIEMPTILFFWQRSRKAYFSLRPVAWLGMRLHLPQAAGQHSEVTWQRVKGAQTLALPPDHLGAHVCHSNLALYL